MIMLNLKSAYLMSLDVDKKRKLVREKGGLTP